MLGESANIGLFDIVVLTSLLYSSESWIFYTYIFDKPAFGNENNEVILSPMSKLAIELHTFLGQKPLVYCLEPFILSSLLAFAAEALLKLTSITYHHFSPCKQPLTIIWRHAQQQTTNLLLACKMSPLSFLFSC